MKDFFQKVQQFRLLILLLFMSTIILLWIGVKDVSRLSDFWINLSAGSATLIGTLFVIDVILDRKKKLEFSEAHDTAKSDLTQLANMMVSYMAAPFKLTVFGLKDISRWFLTVNNLRQIPRQISLSPLFRQSPMLSVMIL